MATAYVSTMTSGPSPDPPSVGPPPVGGVVVGADRREVVDVDALRSRVLEGGGDAAPLVVAERVGDRAAREVGGQRVVALGGLELGDRGRVRRHGGVVLALAREQSHARQSSGSDADRVRSGGSAERVRVGAGAGAAVEPGQRLEVVVAEGEAEDLDVLGDPRRGDRPRQHDVAELDVPAQDELRGGDLVLGGELDDDRVVEQAGADAPAGSTPR